MKILLMNPWFKEVADIISQRTGDLYQTNNYEEALSQARDLGHVSHICIIGGYKGRQAAGDLNEIDPNIKILILGGIETGTNQINFGDDIYTITEKFFKD